MLFLQGTRDVLADLQLHESVCEDLGNRATLKLLPDADHSFHVFVRSGRTDPEVRREMANGVVSWLDRVASTQSGGQAT